MRNRLASASLLTMLLALAVFAQDANDEFFAAARRGDVAAVKAFLDKGGDVNTKNQYGATALSYAADKGHTELVRLLLERGADPNVRDTFYGASPMSWAAPNGHLEIVRLLIEKGATDKSAALNLAIEKDSPELAKAVLDKGNIPAQTLTKALANAEAAKKTAIVELLKKGGAMSFVKVSDATLQTYAGVYKHEQVGTLTFTLKDGTLTGQIAGQRAFTVGAIDETTFTIIEFDGATFTFVKEGDKVTGVNLKQGAGNYAFKRAE